jgi:hypothetical protein
MGKPLMIQIEDNDRIEELKERLGARTKIEVLRTALTLLEADVDRMERVQQWKNAVKVVGSSGLESLREFQTKKRFKKLP